MKTTNSTEPFPFVNPVFSKGTVHPEAGTADTLHRYREAIEALDLNEKENALYMDYDQMDRFRLQLETRLRKTKLWNYTPGQRDEVKEARAYLQNLLGVSASYQ